MSKQLTFNTTDTESIAASDQVGAYIFGSNGTLIDHVGIAGVDRLAVDATLKDGAGTALTSTNNGGKQSLDVNVTSGINVQVDLDYTNDSVTVYQGTSPWVVSATDLDIRNLVFATDKVDVSGSSVSITGDVNVTQGTSPWVVSGTVELGATTLAALETITVNQGTSPWVVSATDLDIRDLTAATDSVSSWTKDGAGTAITSTLVSGKQGLDVNVINASTVDATLANTAILATMNALNTVDTAEAIVASALANRKYLYVYNDEKYMMYIGDSSVDAANGFPMAPKDMIMLRAGPAVNVYFVGETAKTAKVRTLELS